MDLNYYDIGRRIRNERTKQGISQERFAEKSDLSVTHISHIETGNTKLSLPTLVKIANALAVSADELLCDSLVKAKTTFQNEVGGELADCTEQEIRMIADIVKALKTTLRKNI